MTLQVINWTGAIPYGAWACTPATGCDVATPDAYGAQHFEELTNGTLSGGNLTLTWTPESPLTEEMSLGAYLYVPDCDECEEIDLGPDMTGTSPLTMPIAAGFVIPLGMQIHLWAYGGPNQSSSPLYAGTSGAQSFRVDGSLAIAIP